MVQGREWDIERRHQLGERPFIGLTLDLSRPRRSRRPLSLAHQEVTHHRGVERLTPLRWPPALGVKLPGNRLSAMALRVEGTDPRQQLRIIAELIQSGDRTNEGPLSGMATPPVDLNLDLLGLALHRDHHPLNQLAQDGLAVGRRGRGRPP